VASLNVHIHTWRSREVRAETHDGVLVGRIKYKICTGCKKVLL
jgi:hypothetical protein